MKLLILAFFGILRLDGALTIRTDFAGGSLGKVEVLAQDHLLCHVNGETDQDGRNRQASWYYFRVDGGSPGRPLKIDLIDLPGEYNHQPGNLAINGSTRPYLSYDRRQWSPLSDDEVEWDGKSFRLGLRFTPAKKRFWIAHVPPYTGEELSALLRAGKRSSHFSLRDIGKSAQGRALHQVTFTDAATDSKEKRVVWVMARQHAWESGTSWVMDGAIRFLLGSGSGQDRLLKENIFQFFPMADPDGVQRGGVRFNKHGYDVNRNWDVTDIVLMPEIFFLRDAVTQWTKSGKQVDFFVSLHNTNADYVAGPLTSANGRFRPLVERFNELLNQRTFFSGEEVRDPLSTGTPAIGRMSAPEALLTRLGVPAVLVEQNVQSGPKLKRLPQPKDWQEFGGQMVQVLADVVR